MPPSTITLEPVQNFGLLKVDDLIVFRKRLYKIIRLAGDNSENPSIQLEVVWGDPDDTITGWRALSTLTKECAFKVVIR